MTYFEPLRRRQSSILLPGDGPRDTSFIAEIARRVAYRETFSKTLTVLFINLNIMKLGKKIGEILIN